MAIRWLWLGLLLLSASGWAALPGADPYRYHAREWSVEQGLPQVTVTALVQDKQGFIWAGTQSGLARFDGTRFQTFDKGTTPLLPGNRINALAVDDSERLWIGTNYGLALYVSGHFEELPTAHPDTGEINELVASGGGVWVAANNGLFRIDKGQLQARRVAGWTDRAADSIAVGPKGSLWVAVKGGVYEHTAAATPFRFHPLPDPALSVQVMVWFGGHLWAGTNHGLYKLQGGDLKAAEPVLAKRSIRALLAGPSHHLWIGTDASLLRLDNDDQLIDFSPTPGLENKWIWSLGTDRVGDIWVGTGTHGMIRLWNNHIAWFGRSAGLVDQLMTTVYRDRDGSILVGGKSGAYRYRDGKFDLIHGKDDLPNPMVHGFLRLRDGQLWIATVGGLAIMRSGQLVALPKSLAPLAHANVYHLRQDDDGTIWIGAANGLFRYRDKQLHRFGEQDGLDQSFVRGTFRTGEGLLWVATTRGLFEYSQGRFHKLCEPEHLDGPVLDVSRGADGTAWIAIADGALFRYRAGQCKRYVFSDGPLSGSLYYAAPDQHGNLWLTNNHGVYRVAIDQLQAYSSPHPSRTPDVVIQSADGEHQLHPVGGTSQAGLFDPAGHFWVPTVDGIAVIDTNTPSAIAAPAPVVIESIAKGPHVTALAPSPSPVTFPPGETDLRINYAALNYREPESVHFYYRLSGYDRDWVDAGTRREALYTHLPPGRYRFEVRTALPGDAKDVPTAALDLALEPFFYQTWWFNSVLALLAAGLVYAAYALRMRQLRARHVLLERLVATRTDELQEANNKLQQASVTDLLTGLNNRRYFMDAVEKDVAAIRRGASASPHNKEMLFLMLDLDNFKAVNDTHGHQAGDAVLTQLSDLLARKVRASDSVIRWGGEEFLVVARHSDERSASALAEKLRSSIAGYAFEINDATIVSCTCSIGFCAFPFVPGAHDCPTWEDVVNLADAALYKAKRMGKNAWVGIKPTAAAFKTDPHTLQSDLDSLIEQRLATLEAMTPEVSPKNAPGSVP